jgi:hypothetical protein
VSNDPVDVIARTLLYEGYLLYPYRPSAVKNRHRFNFGVLYPEAYCRSSTEVSECQTECLIQGNADTRFDVRVRFLQLAERQRENQTVDSWPEAVEREVFVPQMAVGEAERSPTPLICSFEHQGLHGEVSVGAKSVRIGIYRITVRVSNRTAIDDAMDRDEALLRALVSTHIVIGTTGGDMVSQIDPPDELRQLAASCVNVGLWPVLVGEQGRHDRVLASPIILYDYPQVAPESAGDLYDGTEIDEILALRILTLTEDEKREARDADERARLILDRTESLPAEHWSRLHGAIRGMRKVTGGNHE